MNFNYPLVTFRVLGHNMLTMGIIQRLFSGASDGSDSRASRTSDAAPGSIEALSDELRALQQEISKLRVDLGGDSVSHEDDSGRLRGRRGGRGRTRSSSGSASGKDSGNSGHSGSSRGGRNSRSNRSRNGSGNRNQSDERRRSLPKEPPDDAPVGVLVDYLKKHKVVVFEGQDDLDRNEAFEHLARHLGQHYGALAKFYDKMKKQVAANRGGRISIDSWSERERSAAVQFGTLLHRHGMLKDFYYHRSPRKELRVIPTKDGSTAQFLTGGWLEIYVTWMLMRKLKGTRNAADYQVLQNVKGTLPEGPDFDGGEFEADLMAVIQGKMLWIECKTGHWQDYSARFKKLVKVFGTDRASAGLLLLNAPDSATCRRATDMLDMTLLGLPPVDGFLNKFLGLTEEEVSRTAAPEDRAALGTVPALTDDEIPLKDAPAAKKLGRVDLSGDATPSASSDEEGAPRRRRRRRRGRGRGGSSTSAEAGKTDKPDKATSLHEELPIEKDSVDTAESADKSSEPAQASSDSSSTKPRRSRRGKGRKSSPFQEGDSTETKAAEEPQTEAAPEPEVEEVVSEAKLGASGAMIAPDLAAMMAGAPAVEEVLPQEEPAEETPAKESVAEVVEEAPVPEAVVPEKVAKAQPSAKGVAPTGVTIAPDLAAMMAGGAPAAAEVTTEVEADDADASTEDEPLVTDADAE